MKLARALLDVVKVLEEAGAAFALVGGIAASARGEARFTRDLDVAIAVADDAEAERIVFTFASRGYTILASVEQEATGRLATARLRGGHGIVCDFIFATTGIEAEIVKDASPTEVFSDVLVPTATAEALLAMKTLASTPQRPRDAGDIRAIVLANPDIDEARVIEFLRAIAHRGYARGQDLEEKWKRLRCELGV